MAGYTTRMKESLLFYKLRGVLVHVVRCMNNVHAFSQATYIQVYPVLPGSDHLLPEELAREVYNLQYERIAANALHFND